MNVSGIDAPREGSAGAYDATDVKDVTRRSDGGIGGLYPRDAHEREEVGERPGDRSRGRTGVPTSGLPCRRSSAARSPSRRATGSASARRSASSDPQPRGEGAPTQHHRHRPARHGAARPGRCRAQAAGDRRRQAHLPARLGLRDDGGAPGPRRHAIGERLDRSADDLPDRREPADECGTPHTVRVSGLGQGAPRGRPRPDRGGGRRPRGSPRSIGSRSSSHPSTGP